jgi:hypothetical protein
LCSPPEISQFISVLVRAEAQQPPKIPRIGFLASGSPSSDAALIEAFRWGLRELGYVEGKNIVIDYRFKVWIARSHLQGLHLYR